MLWSSSTEIPILPWKYQALSLLHFFACHILFLSLPTQIFRGPSNSYLFLRLWVKCQFLWGSSLAPQSILCSLRIPSGHNITGIAKAYLTIFPLMAGILPVSFILICLRTWSRMTCNEHPIPNWMNEWMAVYSEFLKKVKNKSLPSKVYRWRQPRSSSFFTHKNTPKSQVTLMTPNAKSRPLTQDRTSLARTPTWRLVCDILTLASSSPYPAADLAHTKTCFSPYFM